MLTSLKIAMELMHVLWDATGGGGADYHAEVDQSFEPQHVNLQHLQNAILCEILQPNTSLLARPLSL
jgi:hypothetical protein